MQLPLTESLQGEQSIEEQYSQGPEVSELQIPNGQNPMTREEAHIFLDNELPLMEKQCLYDKLMIEQFTNDGLLGRRPIAQIPGLLGLELKRREIEVQQYLGAYTGRLSDELQAQKEKEVLQKQEALKTGIQSQLVYTGDNPGEVLAFVKGLPIEDAEPIILDLTGNPEKRVSLSVVDTNYKSGQRSVVLLPTDSIIKCGDSGIWSMTDKELTTVK